MAEKKALSPEGEINAECKRAEFKANPIPKSCSVLIYDQQMREQEEERKKRIHENAQASIKRANMPPRMQKDADRKKQIPPKDL